jgi:hypothetical protein
MEVEKFGLSVEQPTPRPKRCSSEEEMLHRHKIVKQIKSIREKKVAPGPRGGDKVEVGGGRAWKKNKLVMTLDEIKKFL